MKTKRIFNILAAIVVILLAAVLVLLMGVGLYREKEYDEHAKVYKTAILHDEEVANMEVKINGLEFNKNNAVVKISATQNYSSYKNSEEMLKDFSIVYPAVDFSLKRYRVMPDNLKNYGSEAADHIHDKFSAVGDPVVKRSTDFFTEKYFGKTLDFDLKIPAEMFEDSCGKIVVETMIYAAYSSEMASKLPEIGDEKTMESHGQSLELYYITKGDKVRFVSEDELNSNPDLQFIFLNAQELSEAIHDVGIRLAFDEMWIVANTIRDSGMAISAEDGKKLTQYWSDYVIDKYYHEAAESLLTSHDPEKIVDEYWETVV